MKANNKYSSNQIAQAIYEMYKGNLKYAFECVAFLPKKDNRGTFKQYSWNEINNALSLKGWSPANIATVASKLL